MKPTYYQIDWIESGTVSKTTYTVSNHSREDLTSVLKNDYRHTFNGEFLVTEVSEKIIPRVKAFRFVNEREDGTTYCDEVIISFTKANPSKADLVKEYNDARYVYPQSYAEHLINGSTLCAEWGTTINPAVVTYGSDHSGFFKKSRIDKMPGTDEAVAQRRKANRESAAKALNTQRIIELARIELRELLPEGSTVFVERRSSKNATDYVRFYIGSRDITGLVQILTNRGGYNRATKEEKEHGIEWIGLQHGSVGQIAHMLYGNGRRLIEAPRS